MRKTVQIMGIGQRRTGNAKKTGKAYDFFEISFGFPDETYQGYRCETIAVSPEVIKDKQLVVGECVDIVFHQYNFRTFIDAIL